MDDKKQLQILGFNLKMERMKQHLSQDEVAEKLGFSTVYISNIELGKHNISFINAKKFADFYGKTLEYLSTEKP